MAPVTMPGGNPVTAVPGLTPRSPWMRLRPVLVTVDPASTPKLLAVPKPTGATAAPADGLAASIAAAAVSTSSTADTAGQEYFTDLGMERPPVIFTACPFH